MRQLIPLHVIYSNEVQKKITQAATQNSSVQLNARN